MLIAITTIYNLEAQQMDGKMSFLNGELDEEICMEQTKGFKPEGEENKVCKLVRLQYGLKQDLK